MSLANRKLKDVEIVVMPNERIKGHFVRECEYVIDVRLGDKFIKTLLIALTGVRRAHVEGKAIVESSPTNLLQRLGCESAVACVP
jgi:hypothetical protein